MKTNITFCGAGFLGIYHIGVISCFKSHAKRLLDETDKFGGCSAGALAACMLICDVDMEACVQFVMNQSSKVHGNLLGPLGKDFDICTHVRKSCAKHLPADAYQRASGKLYISLTRASDLQNVVVSQYESNSELIDALICTCFIPVFCGIIPPKFKGVAYIDGCFSDNVPQHFEGTTITVSPFGGENDICPDDRHKSSSQFDMQNTNIQFSCHNLYRMTRALFPPDNDVLIKMCQEGFNNALKYLYMNYREYLSFDVSMGSSVPQCCQNSTLARYNNENNGKTVHAIEPTSTTESAVGTETSWASESEAEQMVVIEKALKILVAPNELNEILMKTKLLLEEEKLNWYFVQMLSTMASWSRKPCKYTSACFLNLSKQMLTSLLPKIKNVGSFNIYTQKLMDLVSKGFHAYKETARFEWHPSIKEDCQISIQKSKERLKSVEQSLIAIPHQVEKDINNKTSSSQKKEASVPRDGYEADYDDDDWLDGGDHVTGADNDIIFFNACTNSELFTTKRNNYMSLEEDLLDLNFQEEENESESTSIVSNLTSSMKSLVSSGFTFIYSKSMAFKY